MILRIIKAESLAGVHTHTHTINLINRVNIYKRKGNISLFGNYNDTGWVCIVFLSLLNDVKGDIPFWQLYKIYKRKEKEKWKETKE